MDIVIAGIIAGLVLAVVLSAIVILMIRGIKSVGILPVTWMIALSVICVLPFFFFGAIPGIGMPILLVIIIEIYRKYRASRQYALLWLLTVSAEKGMSLQSALNAFSREYRGGFSRKAARLAFLLDSGIPLPKALDEMRGLLPAHAVPIVRVGCNTGAMAAGLRRAAETEDSQSPLWMSISGKMFYLIMLMMFGLGICTFILMKIVPAFEYIFRDFELELPQVTQTLMSLAHVCLDYWFVFAPIYFLFLQLLLVLGARYFNVNLFGMGWIARRYDGAGVLDALSIVARQQRPMVYALDSLACSHPLANVRGLLSKTADEVRGGGDWAESLRKRGFISRADLAVLQSAQRTDNLAWALREAAESNRRRFMYKLQAVIYTTFPVATIVVGAVVGFVVMGLFIPLIVLINSLT